MKNKLKGLIGKTGELMLYSRFVPEARYNKLVTDLKLKLKDLHSESPDEFESKFNSYIDWKMNYMKLTYPKNEIGDHEKELLTRSVDKFISTTNETNVNLLASTANYLSITDQVIRETYIKKGQAGASTEEGVKGSQGQPGFESNKKDINEESKKIEEEDGFYESKKKRIEAEKIEHGEFFVDKGKLYYGKAEGREPVSYSNWYAGNVDPEQLKKHKELLDRQHFGGPFWEKRKMPKSVLDETFEQYVTGIEDLAPEQHPKELGMKNKLEDSFEQVKR